LKGYVSAHIQQLEEIATLASAGRVEPAEQLAKKLFIGSLKKTDDGRIELVIGGVIDNFVGITYVPKGAQPPEITPGDYIYVEQVSPQWYVFKTT
jgi:hypothetical protein